MKNTIETEDDSENSAAQAFDDMRADLESGECATINSPAWGVDKVYVCSKCLGSFNSRSEELEAIRAEFNRLQFWGNVYFVNERGNVTHLHPDTGAEINSWV